MTSHKYIIVILFCLLPRITCAACTGLSPNWLSTPDYNSISSCNSSAVAGDTITVLAGGGIETWESVLTVTHGIKIVGPGYANLTITSAQANIILYAPDATARANHEMIEISGFRFEATGGMGSGAIGISNNYADYVNVKIHDNYFYQIPGYGAISANGNVYGVIYLNTFDDCTYVSKNVGAESISWDNLTLAFGGSDNLIYEDNQIKGPGTNPFSNGQGGRYIVRYNTWDGYDGCGFFDAHGNQLTGICGTMVTEFYGNNFTNDTQNCNAFDIRGGRSLIFFNQFDQNEAIRLREEFADNAEGSGCTTHIQRVHDTYIWGNRDTVGLMAGFIGQNDGVTPITEDIDFFNHTTDFYGTSGMGCGTLSEMNAITPTVTGVGFWVTTQGNCTDLTGYVGAASDRTSAATKIEGTLYKWDGDSWEAYYTPYTYPHPLRVRKFTGNVMIGGAGLFN